MARSLGRSTIPGPGGTLWRCSKARVVNLETSVTRHGRFAPGKDVHYRMNPENAPALSVARPDVCVLANNHVLDFGREGLEATLDTLQRAGVRAVGAGRERHAAWRPAALDVGGDMGGGRTVVVCSFGMACGGVPANWAATGEGPGVAFLPALSDAAAEQVAARARRYAHAGDLVVASIHWGSNWGYRVPQPQVRFVHRLIDHGVDLVHGHSSHHPRPIEVYREKLILYGCGDFIDDYEGIRGYENFRYDLRLAYFASIHPDTGALAGLRMAPLQACQMRLRHASSRDTQWLRATLDRVSRDFGTRVDVEPDGVLVGRW